MAVEPAQQLQHDHASVERWRFTLDDFYRMGDAGICPPDARVELIDGDVIKVAASSSSESAVVVALDEIMHEGLGRRATISVRGPLILQPHGCPLPDILILKRRNDFYRNANPTAADVKLVIELSDSTLTQDRDVKGPMYAQAGILDYWTVDLTTSRLLVYRDPRDGEYRSMKALTREDSVAPLAFPDLPIAVADILG